MAVAAAREVNRPGGLFYGADEREDDTLEVGLLGDLRLWCLRGLIPQRRSKLYLAMAILRSAARMYSRQSSAFAATGSRPPPGSAVTVTAFSVATRDVSC